MKTERRLNYKGLKEKGREEENGIEAKIIEELLPHSAKDLVHSGYRCFQCGVFIFSL